MKKPTNRSVFSYHITANYTVVEFGSASGSVGRRSSMRSSMVAA